MHPTPVRRLIISVVLMAVAFAGPALAEERGHPIHVKPGDFFSITNRGDSIVYNPRFVSPDIPDVTSYNTLLSSLAQTLPPASRNRENLLLALWRFLSDDTTHVCSPGRDGVSIRGPLELVAGYGYGCCSHVNPAFASVAAHLGFPTEFVSTIWHEYPNIQLQSGWQIVDANRKIRWYDGQTREPVRGFSLSTDKETISHIERAEVETTEGERRALDALELEDMVRDYTEDMVKVRSIEFDAVDATREFYLYPGDSIVFDTAARVQPLTHAGSVAAPFMSLATWRATFFAGRPGVRTDERGHIQELELTAPFPVVGLVVGTPRAEQEFTVLVNRHVRGRWVDNQWVVSPEDIADMTVNRHLRLGVNGEVESLTIKTIMQVNPKLFRIQVFSEDGQVSDSGEQQLFYKDDSGDCRRQVELRAGRHRETVQLGSVSCLNSASDLPSRHDYRREGLEEIVANAKGCGTGQSGLISEPGKLCKAVFELKKPPGMVARAKVKSQEDMEWTVWNGVDWQPVETFRLGRSYLWLELDAAPMSEDVIRLQAKQLTTHKVRHTLVSAFSYEQGYTSSKPSFLSTLAAD